MFDHLLSNGCTLPYSRRTLNFTTLKEDALCTAYAIAHGGVAKQASTEIDD